jgi:hypothetical protein
MDMTSPVDGKLADALRECAAARFTGVLRVDGQPGGTIYLVDGGIAACETPGAPGLEVILLRSRRVSVADWDAAFTAAALGDREMTAELIDRGLLGAGEVEALLRIALADAVFALVSGQVDSWAEGPAADCPLPLTPPARGGWLLNEATRRGQVLASFAGPVVSAQDRVAALPGAAQPTRVLGPGQDELLVLANGRRTARDLAFVLGRGLYETMLQLSRMRAGNVVVVGSDDAAADDAAPDSAAADGTEDDRTGAGLPRRRKDRPGSSRTVEAGRRGLTAGIRLLLPRSEGSTLVDGAEYPPAQTSGNHRAKE